MLFSNIGNWMETVGAQRQHGGRLTGADAAIEARADALASTPSIVHHYFPADDVPSEGSGQDEAFEDGSGPAGIGRADALRSR